jgi:hypothetical protein
MARRNVSETRALLEAVLTSRIVFRPVDDGEPKYELTIPIRLGAHRCRNRVSRR